MIAKFASIKKKKSAPNKNPPKSMAISKKGKRKITVDSKIYLWWVFDGYTQNTFDGVQIKIVAENQVGCFEYGLQQEDKNRLLVIYLRENKYPISMFCPKFEDENGVIKPSGIEKLIRWGLDIKNQNFVTGNNSETLNTFQIVLKEFHK